MDVVPALRCPFTTVCRMAHQQACNMVHLLLNKFTKSDEMLWLLCAHSFRSRELTFTHLLGCRCRSDSPPTRSQVRIHRRTTASPRRARDSKQRPELRMGIELDGIPRTKSVGKEDAPAQRGDYPRTAERWGRQCRIYARRRSWNTLGPVEGCMAAGEPPYHPHIPYSLPVVQRSHAG